MHHVLAASLIYAITHTRAACHEIIPQCKEQQHHQDSVDSLPWDFFSSKEDSVIQGKPTVPSWTIGPSQWKLWEILSTAEKIWLDTEPLLWCSKEDTGR